MHPVIRVQRGATCIEVKCVRSPPFAAAAAAAVVGHECGAAGGEGGVSAAY